MRLWRAVLLAGLAAGCSKPASAPGVADPRPVQASPAPSPNGAAVQTGAAAPAAPDAMPQLAYSYSAEIRAPSGQVMDLLARHEGQCRRAGPAVCQVVGAQLTTSDGETRGVLTIRAEPRWLAALRQALAGDARAAGGRLAGSQTVTEDLTRSIVDTDAALRAKTLLAQRLEALLASRPGKLSDLLEVEQALARTEGEIDAARSELAVMRARVATSELRVTYAPGGGWGAGAWRPVAEAWRGALGVTASSLAALLTLVAALAPFALVAGLVWRFWPRRRSDTADPPRRPPAA